MPRISVPESGLFTHKPVPGKAERRVFARPPHKVRVCHDNRPYVAVPFTIPGIVAAVDYGPMWRVDRDYWIAKIVANVGRHDDGTHPNDGTPSGRSMVMNMMRVSVDLADTDVILNGAARLNIAVNHHQDAVNDAEEGAFAVDDFNIHRLSEGEHIFPRVLHIGSGRPGTGLVVTAVLVPIP